MEQLVGRPTAEFPSFIARGHDRGTFYMTIASHPREHGRQVSELDNKTIAEVQGDWAGAIQRRLVGASGVYLRSQVMLGEQLGHFPMLELRTDASSYDADRSQLLWALGQLEAPTGVIAQAGNRWQYLSPQIISEIGFAHWIKNVAELASSLPQVDPKWIAKAQKEYATELRITCGRGMGAASIIEAPYELAFGSKVNSADE